MEDGGSNFEGRFDPPLRTRATAHAMRQATIGALTANVVDPLGDVLHAAEAAASRNKFSVVLYHVSDDVLAQLKQLGYKLRVGRCVCNKPCEHTLSQHFIVMSWDVPPIL
jgi:hypothetical protein